MKIKPSSRYYGPLSILKSILDPTKVFELHHNEDKDTYSMPFLYGDYKNTIEPTTVKNGIIKSIYYYMEDNLFNVDEKQLLYFELNPYIINYGDELTKRLNSRIALFKSSNSGEHTGYIAELNKTIESIEEIRSGLDQEFVSRILITKSEEPQVFISYSHDDRIHKNWVLQLATRLRNNGVNVLLDQWHLRLGSDLASFMERGLSESNRVLCICSKNYVDKANAGKGGTGYEKQIITGELLVDQNTNWIIPVIRNNKGRRKTPIFLGSKLYIDFENDLLYESNYLELLRDLLDEPVLPVPPIGKNPFRTIKEFSKQTFIPTNERYVSPALNGTVIFDYSNNDGSYYLGQMELMFEVKLVKSSDFDIQLYSDPESILSVSIAKKVKEIGNISDARIFDSSSKVRRPKLNEIAILQNINGFYCAIKILELADDSRGTESDKVVFEYIIQSNGSPDFS